MANKIDTDVAIEQMGQRLQRIRDSLNAAPKPDPFHLLVLGKLEADLQKLAFHLEYLESQKCIAVVSRHELAQLVESLEEAVVTR